MIQFGFFSQPLVKLLSLPNPVTSPALQDLTSVTMTLSIMFQPGYTSESPGDIFKVTNSSASPWNFFLSHLAFCNFTFKDISVSLTLPQLILMCSQVQEPPDYVVFETLLVFNSMSLFFPGSSEIWKLFLNLTPRNLFHYFPSMSYSLALFHTFPIYTLPEGINWLPFNNNCSQIYVSTSFEF